MRFDTRFEGHRGDAQGRKSQGRERRATTVRILLAEDDAMLADAISRALSQSAHAVDVARDGTQADAALAADAYDLAILDVGLPGFDGFEVLRRLRNRRSRVPVMERRSFCHASAKAVSPARSHNQEDIPHESAFYRCGSRCT